MTATVAASAAVVVIIVVIVVPSSRGGASVLLTASGSLPPLAKGIWNAVVPVEEATPLPVWAPSRALDEGEVLHHLQVDEQLVGDAILETTWFHVVHLHLWSPPVHLSVRISNCKPYLLGDV